MQVVEFQADNIITTETVRVEELRAETRERVKNFPFVGATITVAAKP